MKNKLTLNDILFTVINYYDVSLNLVKSDLRRADIIKAKHVYFYLACKKTNKGLVAIGSVINKNHSTVIHGKQKIDSQLGIYSSLKDEIEEIEKMLVPENKMVIENVDLLKMSINYTNSFIKVS